MNVLSLFDSMSCAQIALNRLGVRYDKYFASEVDKYAIKVTQANYPETIQLGNVCEIEVNQLPKIDLLIGGSPCQGFSVAGKGANFTDERSKLLFEYVRVLYESNPKYFLLENVNMKKEYQDIITGLLAVKPIMIDSALLSAQSRKRLYWTNIPNVVQPEDKGISFHSILESGCALSDKAYALTYSYYRGGGEGTRLRCLARSLRPIAIMSSNHSRWLTPVECERLQTVPDNYTGHVSKTQRYRMLGNGMTVDIIAHILKEAFND